MHKLIMMFLFVGYYGNLFAQQIEWTKEYSEGDLNVFSGKIEGSDLLAFKGEIELKDSLENIYYTLQDVPHQHEWINKVKYAKEIKFFKNGHNQIYSYASLPWPVSDRDTLVENKCVLNLERKEVYCEIKSAEDGRYPKDQNGVVRVEVYKSTYTLRKLNKDKIFFSLSVFADPRGWFPSWLVNFMQKDWPKETLAALQKQMVNREIKPDKKTLDFLRPIL